jgi:hypothetical protein
MCERLAMLPRLCDRPGVIHHFRGLGEDELRVRDGRCNQRMPDFWSRKTTIAVPSWFRLQPMHYVLSVAHKQQAARSDARMMLKR